MGTAVPERCVANRGCTPHVRDLRADTAPHPEGLTTWIPGGEHDERPGPKRRQHKRTVRMPVYEGWLCMRGGTSPSMQAFPSPMAPPWIARSRCSFYARDC